MIITLTQKNLSWTPMRQRLQSATNKNTTCNKLVEYTWTTKLVGDKSSLQSVMSVALQNATK